MLSRRDDGNQRLIALVNERRLMPYAYGRNDCWCFARAAVEAATGETLLPDLEPPKSWLAAARVMIANGWESVEDLMTETLGPPMADPKESRPGDIVSFEMLGDLHLAVRVGETALTPGRDGLNSIGRDAWRNAWRVG